MSRHLMRTAAPLGAALMLVAAATSCRNLNTKQAVQSAIETHLRQNSSINRTNFTAQIETVDFKGKTANALVTFQSKHAPNLTVHIRYQLKRSGSHWLVMSSQPAGGRGMDSHIGPESPGEEPATPEPNASVPPPVASH